MKIRAIMKSYPHSIVYIIAIVDHHAVVVDNDGDLLDFCFSELRVIDPEYLTKERSEGYD